MYRGLFTLEIPAIHFTFRYSPLPEEPCLSHEGTKELSEAHDPSVEAVEAFRDQAPYTLEERPRFTGYMPEVRAHPRGAHLYHTLLYSVR